MLVLTKLKNWIDIFFLQIKLGKITRNVQRLEQKPDISQGMLGYISYLENQRVDTLDQISKLEEENRGDSDGLLEGKSKQGGTDSVFK